MTRKPDGWIAKKILGYHTSEPYLLIRLKFKTQLDNLKIDDLVAIVPPELLTWVEKVRDMMQRKQDCDVQSPFTYFLDELEGILPSRQEGSNAILPLSEANNSKSEDKSND